MSLVRSIFRKYSVVAYDPAERKLSHVPERQHSYDPRDPAHRRHEETNHDVPKHEESKETDDEDTDKDVKVYLETVWSEIFEDDFEKGEGKSVGAGLHVKVGKTFPSLQKMVEWVASNYDLSKDLNDYHVDQDNLQTDRQVADHGDEQNGGWMKPTPEEVKQWKAGNLMLYNEHFDIHYHKVA